MSVRYKCAICGKATKKANLEQHVCKDCRRQYDVSEAWVQELIRAEEAWHKSRQNNAPIMTFSSISTRQDGRFHDGDDMANGDVAFPHKRRGHIPKSRKQQPSPIEPSQYLDNLEIVLQWGDVAELSDNERQAIEVIVLFMQNQTISLEGASQILSEIEGHDITPFEFQERLNRARQKLMDAGIKI
ncbi:MAG: hypothetical protein AAF846_24965 [Chloroflexota bacterium]